MATLAEILRQTGYSQDGTLTAPATDSPMTKALSEHIKTLPQQLATNQAALDSAIGSWNKTDFGTGLPNPNYRPEAMAELTQLMPGIGGMIAYHGTPHTIQGKFDLNKVGTGEGNQSYGHGMYFAENPNVAKGYQETLGQKKDIAVFKGNDGFYVKKGLGSEGQNLAGPFPSSSEAEKIRKALPENQGNLYKVDIPDEYIPNMLDWDKPFKDQSPSVKAAIKQLEPKIKQINPNLNVENLDGKGIYHAYQQYRGNQPDFASEGMNELGIKGIRYLDQGSRNPGFSSLTPTQLQARIDSLQTDIKSGGGNQTKIKDQLKALQNEMDSYKNMTSNFVVFDPSTVKILEENSKPVSLKEIIEKQVKALKD